MANTPTPVAINSLPLSPGLHAEDLFITEYHGYDENDNAVAETQKTTLQAISDWICGNTNNTFNIKPEQVMVFGANLGRQVSDNVVTIGFKIPNWTQGVTYHKDDVVKYEDCYYQCLAEESSNLASTPMSIENEWSRIGYKVGRRLSLSEDNTLTGLGVEIWAPNTSYNQDDFVYYNKRLYKCDVANTDTEWNGAHWQNIGEGNGIIPYVNEKNYDLGTIVIKEGRLFQKISASGVDLDWVPNHWVCISNGDYSKTFVKYCDVDPSDITNENVVLKDTPDQYMGIYVGKSENPPTGRNDYQWYKIKGEDGYVNVEANMAVINITLDANEWSVTAPYSQTVNNNNLQANMYPFIDVTLSDDSEDWEEELLQYSYLTRAVCHTGSITFYCKDTVPTEDINLKLRINGDTLGSTYVTNTEFTTFKNQILNLVNNMNTLLQNTLEGN